jgi:hypothetical protein
MSALRFVLERDKLTNGADVSDDIPVVTAECMTTFHRALKHDLTEAIEQCSGVIDALDHELRAINADMA